MIKLIAVGNRLMGDDGIAISVAEELKNRLESRGIITVIGETDPFFCMTQIDEEDELILLDAMELIESGLEPGTLVVLTLDEAISSNLKTVSQHETNLCTLLRLYGYKNKGFFIGIIVPVIENKISFLATSDLNGKQFDELCEKVELLVNDLTEQRV